MGKLFHLLRRVPIQPITLACRRMASPRGTDHLTVTKFSSRQEVLAPAIVTEIKNESETIKRLTLQINHREFSFKAGQWVDTFIPSVETVGGFSICSSPTLLKSADTLILAVKFSKHPPAHWIHTKCKPGDQVLLRSGGSFCFDPQPGEEASNILMIAGGVGINPLFSMIQHVADLNLGDKPYAGKVKLLYSARTVSELIFKRELEVLSSVHPNIDAQFFATRDEDAVPPVLARRIGREDIQKVVKCFDSKQLRVYMCGPALMMCDMEELCFDCGIPEKLIFYERWW